MILLQNNNLLRDAAIVIHTLIFQGEQLNSAMVNSVWMCLTGLLSFFSNWNCQLHQLSKHQFYKRAYIH